MNGRWPDPARLGEGLSLSARKVWAKSDQREGGRSGAWLPLWRHMADSGAVAGRLWDYWLPRQVRRLVASVGADAVAALGCVPGGYVEGDGDADLRLVEVRDVQGEGQLVPGVDEAPAENEEDIGARVRRALRDHVHAAGLLERCVRDVKTLLAPGMTANTAEDNHDPQHDRVTLQSDRGEELESGHNLGEGTIW